MPSSDVLPPPEQTKAREIRRDPKVSRTGTTRPPIPAKKGPAPMKVWRGWPYPLGASWMGTGTNFSIFSQHATGVELCLFDDLGEAEIARVRLTDKRDHVWHGFLPEVRPGQLYGFRVEGPYEPQH